MSTISRGLWLQHYGDDRRLELGYTTMHATWCFMRMLFIRCMVMWAWVEGQSAADLASEMGSME